MDPDLVSFGDLSCDQLRVGLHRGAQHEEGGPHAQPRQHVEHPWSPTGIRPVVEGQRQLSGLPVGLEDHSRTERAAGARRARGGSGRGGEVGVPPVSGSCAAARAENRGAPAVVITGGERTPSNALVGLVAIDALSTMRVEWVFLGAHGFTPEAGLMTPNLQEASANQALVAAGRTVVATLDSSKWGVLGLRSFCATRDIGVLVTEAEPDADVVDALQQAGTRLTIAT